MAHCSIYVTTPDADVARHIARILVEEQLAACVNILGPIASVYRWQGAVHEEDEVALIAKTTVELTVSVIARIKALHPHQAPCIVAWPIEAGYQPYLDWISAETRI